MLEAPPPKPRRWYRPWSWFRRDGDPRFEDALLTEEERAAARALEAALDIEPGEIENGEPAPKPSQDPAAGVVSRTRRWSEDEPDEPPMRATAVRGRAIPQKVKGTPGVSAVIATREMPRRSRQTMVAPRARLHVEDKPTGEAQDSWGLAKLSEAVTAASSRDELVREVVEYVAQHFKRTAVFAVRQQCATGWMGKGPGFFPERIDQTTIPLDRPSLFMGVQTPYIGPVPDIPENRELYAFLGGPIPPAVVIVPVMVRDRLVSVLYADNDSEPLVWVDLAIWKRVAEMMAIALEIIILKNKARSL